MDSPELPDNGVDIRSTKICELGLLNYKAKHVFYPFEKSKFRCRYDYYWTSVFKVEYKDHSLDQTQLALTEAPNEALPLSCRPNFGAAWLTKDKFKVNETYDCWYSLGISTIKLYDDGFFNCQAKDPSSIEMMKRYLIISTRILRSWFSSKGRARYLRWETIAGVVTGFSTSIITISFIRILQHIKSSLPEAINTARVKRVCFLVVYFSFVCWLTSQYWRRLNIPLIRVYNYYY
ncbi:hypothetical protein V6N13_145299 [Hibiscus sabdariffa]|uniref:Uncharacterized protein n=2 Tax=Hibiscus sabdariffa TaxID=183260 RepID=A0ABR1ZYZ1_9ROSI